MAQVAFHGVERHEHRLSDLRVAHPARGQLGYPALAGGQRLQPGKGGTPRLGPGGPQLVRRPLCEPLREGLDLAYRGGAGRLAQRATDELRAAGAKPRRASLTGLEALTPSERRVAELAASGMSNPEIAQAVFVTLNTVEGHLRHVYQKLSVSSRTELPAALRSAVPQAG